MAIFGSPTANYNIQVNRKIFVFWLACGLSIQVGMVFWPIGNYATLVYLMFFLPLICLLVIDRESLTNAIVKSDRLALLSLVALLFWIQTASLRPNAELDTGKLFWQTLKYNILILLYVTGIAYLAKQWPKVFFVSLLFSFILIAILASLSIYHIYFIIDHASNFRISIFGLGDFAVSANPATAGIYFGSISTIVVALLFNRPPRSSASISILLLIISLPCLAITFLTGTRSAMVGFLAAAILCLLFDQKSKFGMVLCTIVFGLLIYGLIAKSTYFNNLLMRDGFGGWRPEIWKASIQLSLENFWFGAGMWRDTSVLVTRDGVSQIMPHSHNHYLQLLIWTGVTGLTLYICLLSSAIRKYKTNKNDPLIGMASISLVYFIIVQFFDVFSIFTKPSYYWPCIWLPIGIIIGRSQTKPTEKPSNAAPYDNISPSN